MEKIICLVCDSSCALAQLSPGRNCFAPLFPEMGRLGPFPLVAAELGLSADAHSCST